jgi:hypothetical protein
VHPHRFRPFDVVLGIAVAIVGVLVAMFGFEGLDEDNVFVWLAIGAGVLGVSLLPWPHRRSAPTVEPAPEPAPPLPDESSPDG